LPLPAPYPGLVISYAFLWWEEHERGQEEGTKARPCAIVLLREREGAAEIVTVAPITHTTPADPRLAVEIPAVTKRRLGLDDQRSWIVLSDLNRFEWPGPDLRPVSREEPMRFAYGPLPPVLFREVLQRLAMLVRERLVRTAARQE
jgi:hypothetical protein